MRTLKNSENTIKISCLETHYCVLFDEPKKVT